MLIITFVLMLSRVNMIKFKLKGQAFVQDLIIAIFIIVIFFIIFLNIEKNDVREDSNLGISSEAKVLSDYLVSTGYPIDWNISNVVRIGITDDNNILDKEKLNKFYNLTRDDYENVRYILGVKNDFIVFFTDYNGNLITIENLSFFGKPGYNLSKIESDTPSNLFKVSRFVVLKEQTVNITSKIIEMKIYVWKR